MKPIIELFWFDEKNFDLGQSGFEVGRKDIK